MATIQAIPTNGQYDLQPHPNLMPYFATFNKNTNFTEWGVSEGEGTGENVDTRCYYGDRSLFVQSTDDDEDLRVNAGSYMQFTAKESGWHFLCWFVFNPIDGVESADFCTLSVYKDGDLFNEYYTSAHEMPKNKWTGFYTKIQLSEGEVLDFAFLLPQNDNYPSGGSHSAYYDGLGLYLDDRNAQAPPAYRQPQTLLPISPSGDGDYLLRADSGAANWEQITT